MIKVTTHYGTIIVLSKIGYSINIIPSKFDRNKVDGVFSNNNGNQVDDFLVDQVQYDVNNLKPYFNLYK